MTNLLTNPLVLAPLALVLAVAVGAVYRRRKTGAESGTVRFWESRRSPAEWWTDRRDARQAHDPAGVQWAVERKALDAAEAAVNAVPTTPAGWLLVVARIGVAVVGVTALVLSYGALHSLALAAHIEPRLAWLWPVAVDVLAVVSAVAARTLSGSRWATLYAWLVLAAFLGLSVWGNGQHATLDVVRTTAGEVVSTLTLTDQEAVIVSATPPVALALALHLLLLMISHAAKHAATSDAEPDVWRGHDPREIRASLVGLIDDDEVDVFSRQVIAHMIGVPAPQIHPESVAQDEASKADKIRAALTLTGGNGSAAHELLEHVGHGVSKSYVFRLAKPATAGSAPSLNGSAPAGAIAS